MDRKLHDMDNLQQIMELTSDTLILLSAEGVCLDVVSPGDLWFLQPEVILDKNVLALLPSHTYHKLIIDFQRVLTQQVTLFLSFRLPLRDATYYGECKLVPYEGCVLCRYTDITNRENVKFKLSQAYEEMQEIQNVARIGKWILDTETNTIQYIGFYHYNDEAKTLKISVSRYMRLVIPEDREKVANWLDGVLEHRSSTNISFRVRMAGNIHYMSVKCIYRKKNVHHQAQLIEGIIQNVSEMHRRRNDINMLTHVIFNANESIYGALPDGTLKFANQIFRNTHHIGVDEDISAYKIYHTNCGFAIDQKMWQERVAAMDDKIEINFTYDSPIIDKDEEQVIYEGKFYKMTEDDGSYSFWSFAYDATKRIRYESEMKRSNELISTIFKNIPASISVKDVDDDYRFIYRNSLTEDSRKVQKDMMSKAKLTDFDIYPEDEAKNIRLEDMKVNETGEPFHQVTQGINARGEVMYFDILKLKISDPNFSPMILCIKWNITPIEMMKRKLVSAKQKAEESDRLKTIFLANISHEIRTPLNAIVGFSNIMVECEDAKQRDSYHKIIDQSTKRLLKFINEILLLSRIESGEVKLTLSDVHLDDLCNEVYDLADSESPQTVDVIYEAPRQKTVIKSDENYIIQIFMILIRTSFKFIDKGQVWFGYEDKGDVVECYVKDNGKGLVNEEEDVFSLFTRYNYGNDGSELELTICHAIVQMMGGSITAESKKDIGSKFIFTLPKQMGMFEDD
jgi:signal transduction histidine kinase